MCVYEALKEMLGKTNAKMFYQEMEIKKGMVPGSLP